MGWSNELNQVVMPMETVPHRHDPFKKQPARSNGNSPALRHTRQHDAPSIGMGGEGACVGLRHASCRMPSAYILVSASSLQRATWCDYSFRRPGIRNRIKTCGIDPLYLNYWDISMPSFVRARQDTQFGGAMQCKKKKKKHK